MRYIAVTSRASKLPIFKVWKLTDLNHGLLFGFGSNFSSMQNEEMRELKIFSFRSAYLNEKF